MRVILTRSSVAMGDDVDAPHEVRRELIGGMTLADVLLGVVRSHYLASIAGGHATWVVHCEGSTVAVVAQQWAAPRYLVDPRLEITAIAGSSVEAGLFFQYRQQENPDAVYEELAARPS